MLYSVCTVLIFLKCLFSHSHSKLLRKKEVLVFCFGRNGSCQPRRNGKTGLGLVAQSNEKIFEDEVSCSLI